jgi:hypothetical protein
MEKARALNVTQGNDHMLEQGRRFGAKVMSNADILNIAQTQIECKAPIESV